MYVLIYIFAYDIIAVLHNGRDDLNWYNAALDSILVIFRERWWVVWTCDGKCVRCSGYRNLSA